MTNRKSYLKPPIRRRSKISTGFTNKNRTEPLKKDKYPPGISAAYAMYTELVHFFG